VKGGKSGSRPNAAVLASVSDDVSQPFYFLEPRIASFAFELLDDVIGDDGRFFFFDPSRPDRDYNYDDNQRLVDAIGKGYRGAYWDILRRYE